MDTLGLFQLENLIHSGSFFLFLDLRTQDGVETPAQITSYLARATKVVPRDVQSHLKSLGAGVERPITLISEDGKEAEKVALELESAGYQNIYIIEGGVAGLVAEL